MKVSVTVTVTYETGSPESEHSENVDALAEFLVHEILTGKRKFPTKFTRERGMKLTVHSEKCTLPIIE